MWGIHLKVQIIGGKIDELTATETHMRHKKSSHEGCFFVYLFTLTDLQR